MNCPHCNKGPLLAGASCWHEVGKYQVAYRYDDTLTLNGWNGTWVYNWTITEIVMDISDSLVLIKSEEQIERLLLLK